MSRLSWDEWRGERPCSAQGPDELWFLRFRLASLLPDSSGRVHQNKHVSFLLKTFRGPPAALRENSSRLGEFTRPAVGSALRVSAAFPAPDPCWLPGPGCPPPAPLPLASPSIHPQEARLPLLWTVVPGWDVGSTPPWHLECPRAAVTNHHTFNGLKQHGFIILQLCGSPWAKVKVPAGPCSFPEALGEHRFHPFQLPGAACLPWLSPSFILRVNDGFSSFNITSLRPSSAFKDLCDYTGLTLLTQDHPLCAGHLASNLNSICSLDPLIS